MGIYSGWRYFVLTAKLLCILLILNFMVFMEWSTPAGAVEVVHRDEYTGDTDSTSPDMIDDTDNNSDTGSTGNADSHADDGGKSGGSGSPDGSSEPGQYPEPGIDPVNPGENSGTAGGSESGDHPDDNGNVDIDEPGSGVEGQPEPTDPAEGGDGSPDEGGPDDAEPAITQTTYSSLYRSTGTKVAYLTFDDGPTPQITSDILDILKEEDVKATFFPIGSNAEQYPWLIRREYEEGHGIANHTYSHVFDHIYGSVDNLITELQKTEELLKGILELEHSLKLFRFPGGSFGEKRAPFREAANEAGYFYMDWNCVNGDAESSKNRTKDELIQRLMETVNNQSSLIILMHDAPRKTSTVEALPEILKYLKSLGYKFELLPGSR